MKTQISYKKMLELAQYRNQQIYRIGYCDWQNLFSLLNKLNAEVIKYYQMPYYSAGIYGWNCDYYKICLENKTVIIATGYRTSGKFKQVEWRQVDFIEQYAKARLEELAPFDKLEKSNEEELRKHLKIAKELEQLVNLVL